MKGFQKGIFFILGLFLVGFATGCTGNPKENPGEKKLPSLEKVEFEAGSFFGGHGTYEIRREKEAILFSARGMNGMNMNIVDEKLTQEELDSVETWFAEHNIQDWNGFDERDEGVLDGHSFSLRVTYEDGSTFYARGYEKYPKGYKEADPEAFFLNLAKAHGYQE